MKFLLKMRSLRTKCLILVSHGCISVILQAQGSAWRSRTLPVTWESKGTSSTLAFWPWSKKALKHMLNFKHECSHPHKRTTYSPKIKHLQKYFTVSASLLSILQDYTLSSDSQKKNNPQKPHQKPQPKQKLTSGRTADCQELPKHMWHSPMEAHVLPSSRNSCTAVRSLSRGQCMFRAAVSAFALWF